MTRRILIAAAYLAIAAAFVALYSGATSPLMNGSEGDVEIFHYMGYTLLSGQVPYTDVFDHKGLLLYVIYALGLLISQHWGVMLIQVASLWLSLCLWHWGMRGLGSHTRRTMATLLALFALYIAYGTGGFSEEFSLPFLSLPLAIYCRRTTTGRGFPLRAMAVTGFAAGCCCLLRLNNSAPLLALTLWIIGTTAYRRQWRLAARQTAGVVAGGLLPVALAVLLMWAIGGARGVSDMWFANITFNLEYLRVLSPRYDMERLTLMYKSVLPAVLLLPLIRREAAYCAPLILGVALTAATVGGWLSPHYLIPFVPLSALIFARLTAHRYGRIALVALLLLFVKTFANELGSYRYQRGTQRETQAAFATLVSGVPEAERQRLWCFEDNSFARAVIAAECKQANRMFLNFQLNISPRLRQSEGDAIARRRPRLIVVLRDGRCTIGSPEDLRRGETEAYRGYSRDIRHIVGNYRLARTVAIAGGDRRLCLYERRH